MHRVEKTAAEWRAILTPEEYAVCREHGTERAFTGCYYECHTPGTYHCTCCGTLLFKAAEKYDSGSGWPSFWEPADPANIAIHTDHSHGMTRTEVLCAVCDAHLGHVFPDGPPPTGLRYCINSLCLKLRPAATAGEA